MGLDAGMLRHLVSALAAAQTTGSTPPAGVVAIERVGHGRSMTTWLVRAEGREIIARHAPPGVREAGTHNVERESIVLRALGRVNFPVPRVLALQHVDELNGPVLVLEKLDGTVIHGDPRTFYPSRPALAQEVADGLISQLIRLHSYDPASLGLQSFGRPRGYVERQVARWTGEADALLHGDSALLATLGVEGWSAAVLSVAAWLTENIPRSHRSAIVHGDYGVHNVMLAADDPGHIRGVLDWEMSTLGDPYCDISWLASMWPPRLEPGNQRRTWADLPEMPVPSPEDIVAAYAGQTAIRGRPPWNFYYTLSKLKRFMIVLRRYTNLFASKPEEIVAQACLGECQPLLEPLLASPQFAI